MQRWVVKGLSCLLLLVPLSGCILIAPNFDPVANCPIHGESPCGTCLRANCQGEINNCCGTKECRENQYSLGTDDEQFTTISALDACAAGNSSCSLLLNDARKSPAGVNVNTCVQNKCRAECVPNAPVAKWSCDTPHGDDDCSSCIFSKCESQVTSCCTEGTGYGACPTVLQDEMTACTTNDGAGCATMQTNSEAGKAGVVRACVTNMCAVKCFGNGRQHQSCTLQKGGAYCTCTNAKTTSGDECSTTTVAKSHCFFTSGGCVCGHYSCVATNLVGDYPACNCTMTNATDGTGTAGKCNPDDLGVGGPQQDRVALCCLNPGDAYESPSCKCDTLNNNACPSGSYQVFSCDKTSFFSALADVRTDSCYE